MKRNILRDTILITVIQMLLDGLALLLNVWLTRQLGTEAIGILTLTSSFFRLAALTSNGNAFLCVSRFVSEELGRPERDPGRVMVWCIGVSMGLSAVFAGLLTAFAPWCSVRFLHSAELAAPIRLMGYSLPLIALGACVKGWFNACCRSGLCSAADVAEFFVRCGYLAVCVRMNPPGDPAALCSMTAWSIIIGAGAQLLFLLCFLPCCRVKRHGSTTVGLRQYLRGAIPVMAGSALTSVLSSANDALVPVTLRQAGSSTDEAFSQFGIFEGIILPTLFFPSTILCSLAGILVTETAREKTAGGALRITSLTEQAVRKTIVFAVYVTGIFLLFGHELGEWLGGGAAAGRMIVLLAPAVPFIYLEIVLESIIKGLGKQGFSSFNYLCEYIIRIGCVLVFIPLFGFYGIVLSYYASNIFGNLNRILRTAKLTGMSADPVRLLGVPVFAMVFAVQLSRLATAWIHGSGGIPGMAVFCVICGGVYLIMQRGLYRLYGEPVKPFKQRQGAKL